MAMQWRALQASALLLVLPITAKAMPQPAPGSCRPVPAGAFVSSGHRTRIYVRTVGSGSPALMIPSLARGVADFDKIAADLAGKGFMSILPDPRGTGRSTAEQPADLFSLAADNAAVIASLCRGPIDVVGHAFGNRVARALAARHPQHVRSVALLAGGGEVEMQPDIRAALAGSLAQGTRPDDQRLADLRLAFFARGNDPSVWLDGWFPKAAPAQMAAAQRTPLAEWWRAGRAPLLLIQADEDPIAPAGNATKLREDVGARLSMITLAHASHAILPEQGKSVVSVLAAYFRGERDEAKLQRMSDRDALTRHAP